MNEMGDHVARRLYELSGGPPDAVRAPWRQSKWLIAADEIIKLVLDREKIGHWLWMRANGHVYDEEQCRRMADQLIEELKHA